MRGTIGVRARANGRSAALVGSLVVMLVATAACSGDETEAATGGGADGASTTSSTATGSTSPDETDEEVARRIAIALDSATTFLWNRDMNPLLQTDFSTSGNCLLAGGYAADGTRALLDGNCNGVAAQDISITATSCEHEGLDGGESITFDGALEWVWSSTYEGSCASPTSTTATLTATGISVALTRSSGFERTFDDCVVELNLNKDAGGGVLAGRVCDVPVRVDYQ